jgi:hypothetical protein
MRKHKRRSWAPGEATYALLQAWDQDHPELDPPEDWWPKMAALEIWLLEHPGQTMPPIEFWTVQ